MKPHNRKHRLRDRSCRRAHAMVGALAFAFRHARFRRDIEKSNEERRSKRPDSIGESKRLGSRRSCPCQFPRLEHREVAPNRTSVRIEPTRIRFIRQLLTESWYAGWADMDDREVLRRRL